MTSDFNAGKTALDKVNELEKRFAYSAAKSSACVYSETQREISLTSSEIEKNVILNYEWDFFKKEASLLNFVVTTPQKGAVNIKLDFNGTEIFNGAMTDKAESWSNEEWMLHQWGIEFLSEGRRRRTDLRRFDQFTQGQWWFFGRATDDAGVVFPAKRSRKYEWYPLPQNACAVNPGLVQNPNY